MEAEQLYEEHRASVRRFAEAEVKPYAAIVDEEARYPSESMSALPKLDLTGLPFPQRLGGSDGDLFAQVIAVEEIARVCACTAHLMLTSWVAMMPLIFAGDDALQRHIVPDVAAGRTQASFCLTEPGGGSNVAGGSTAPSASCPMQACRTGIPFSRAMWPGGSASSWCIAMIRGFRSAARNGRWGPAAPLWRTCCSTTA